MLVGDWPTDEVIHNIIDNSDRKNENVIFEKDPKVMITKLIEMVRKKEASGEIEVRL